MGAQALLAATHRLFIGLLLVHLQHQRLLPDGFIGPASIAAELCLQALANWAIAEPQEKLIPHQGILVTQAMVTAALQAHKQLSQLQGKGTDRLLRPLSTVEELSP